MEGVDFIQEIRIAQFWRKHLGDYEYVYFNPEDLRRWYVALENRGPEEIRDYLIERSGRHPIGEVTGIVSVAPHPPLNIINVWLDSYNKVRTGSYWLGGIAFLVFVYYSATTIAGCQAIKPMTPLQQSPPPIGLPGAPIQPPAGPVPAGSTLPTSPPQAPPSPSQGGQPSGPAQ